MRSAAALAASGEKARRRRETGGTCMWGPPVREPKERGGVGKVGPAGLWFVGPRGEG